jgi:hypothetical protein
MELPGDDGEKLAGDTDTCGISCDLKKYNKNIK